MKISRQLLFSLLAFTLIPLIIVTFVSYLHIKNESENTIKNQLTNTLNSRKDEIKYVIDRDTTYISQVVSDVALVEDLNTYYKNPSKADLVALKAHLEEKRMEERCFDKTLYLLDKDGKVITGTTNDPLSEKISQEAVDNDIFGFYNVGNEISIYASQTIIVQGEKLGTIVLKTPTEELYTILKRYSELGSTGETILVGSDGAGKIIYLAPLRFDSDAALAKYAEDAKLPEVKTFKQDQDTFYGSSLDYRGKEVFASSTLFAKPRWAVIVKVDKSEIYKLSNGTRNISFGLSGLILIFTSLFGYFILKATIKPLSILRDSLHKMALGDFKQRIEIHEGGEAQEIADNVNFIFERMNALKERLEYNAKVQAEGMSAKLVDLENTKKAILNILEDEKVLEAAVKEERDRAKAIITSMGDGLVLFNKDKQVVMLNPIAQRILGVTQKDLQGVDYTHLIKLFKGDKEVVGDDRPLARVFKTGEIIQTTIDDDYYYVIPSGRKFPIVFSTSPLRGNGITGAVLVIKDVTQDKEAKKFVEKEVDRRTDQVQQEKAKLVAAINSVPRGFVIFGSQGEILLTNNKLAGILGIEQPMGWTMDLIHNSFNGSFDFTTNYKACLTSGTPVDKPEVMLGAKYLHVYMSPIYGIGNVIIGVVLFIEDITEAKVLDRSKDEFFSIASHELRTPLTAIRGNISMMKELYADKFKGDKELTDMVDDIHNSSVRLIGIVNDFLSLSRLQMGKMEFKNENFDAKVVADEVVHELEGTVKEKKLMLAVGTAPEATYPVFGDKLKIKEVLVNLIGNAVKFTDSGGITIDLSMDDKFVTFKVVDTGRGIPAANQALLFRRFQQAGSSLYTRDTSKGTGLGLYISKLIVEGMGGKIYLEKSEEGKGSTFAFTIAKGNLATTPTTPVAPANPEANFAPDFAAPTATTGATAQVEVPVEQPTAATISSAPTATAPEATPTPQPEENKETKKTVAKTKTKTTKKAKKSE